IPTCPTTNTSTSSSARRTATITARICSGSTTGCTPTQRPTYRLDSGRPFDSMTLPSPRTSLYVQVLIGIGLGVLVGLVWPETGAAMRPLGDGFIKLVRMLIAPIIFTTIAVGIGQMGAMREVGRIGFRALAYFEMVSTVALLIGLVVVNV